MPSAHELIAHNRSTEDVSKLIGADWLVYQDLPDLIDAVGGGKIKIDHFDCAVFDGEYVTGDVNEAYLNRIEQARNDATKAKSQAVSAIIDLYNDRQRESGMTQDWDAGRLDSDLEGAAFDTLAVRAGQRRTPEGEHGEALFTTSSYVFRTAADAAARFAGEVPGNVYSRYTNPTVRTFEERIAALEGAEQAVATASGMSAILALVMSLCSSGDHVLVSRSVFGSTISLFDKYFKRFGIQVDYPPLSDLAAWEAACKPNTKLFFVESPSNPLAELVDIAALAEIAHAKGALLAVDNCFCTPACNSR